MIMNKLLLPFFFLVLFILPIGFKANGFKLDSLKQTANKLKSKDKLELLEKYTRNYPTNVELIEILE